MTSIPFIGLNGYGKWMDLFEAKYLNFISKCHNCKYNHNVSYFHTWIAVSGSLSSPAHGHHRFQSFLPGDALPVFQLQPLSVAACSWAFMLCWLEIRRLTWPLENIPFLCLQNVFSCFCWICFNVSRDYGPRHLRFHCYFCQQSHHQ